MSRQVIRKGRADRSLPNIRPHEMETIKTLLKYGHKVKFLRAQNNHKGHHNPDIEMDGGNLGDEIP